MTQHQTQTPIDTSTDPQDDALHTNGNRHGLSRLSGKTAIATDINAAGWEAVFIRTDMADPDDSKGLIEETVARFFGRRQ